MKGCKKNRKNNIKSQSADAVTQASSHCGISSKRCRALSTQPGCGSLRGIWAVIHLNNATDRAGISESRGSPSSRIGHSETNLAKG